MFINKDGLRIFYEVYGQGEAIVLLHHGFGSSRIWEEIYPGLNKEGYQTVLYDRRGYGNSDDGSNFEEFYKSGDFRRECVRELEILRRTLCLESFHIVGQCEGGVVGIDYAVAYPERVESVTASATQCYSEIDMHELNSRVFSKEFKELNPKLRAKLEGFHGPGRAASKYELFRTYGGCYGTYVFDLRPQLCKVSCPALVLFPDRSAIFDVQQGVSFYQNLAKGELVVLPACGHNTYEYQPQNYVRQVLEFLDRNKVQAWATNLDGENQ